MCFEFAIANSFLRPRRALCVSEETGHSMLLNQLGPSLCESFMRGGEGRP